MKPFAVFIVAKIGDLYCGTTRDDGNKPALMGGKTDDTDLSPSDTALREAKEEGFSFPSDTKLSFLYQTMVDGKLVQWLTTDSQPTMLTHYKEMNRIKPILMTKSQLLSSGFCNDQLPL